MKPKIKNFAYDLSGVSEVSSQRTKDKEDIDDKISQQAAFVENNPALVFRTDSKSVIDLVNPAATQVFEKELKGESVFSIFTNLDKNSFNLLESSKHLQFEETIGDTYSMFTLRKISLSDSVYIFNANITFLKKAEQTLIDSEEKFRGISVSSQDAIITLNEDQHTNFFSKRAEKTFGFDAGEVHGKSIDILLPKRYAEDQRNHIKEITASQEESRQKNDRKEIFGRRKDGTEFPVETSISKMSINGQRGYTAYLRDISERKQAMEAVKKSERRFCSVWKNSLDGINIGFYK